MSTQTHTPGPWRYEFIAGFDCHPRVMADKDGERVCIASTIGTKTTRDKLSRKEKAANTQLLSLAPELLQFAEAYEAMSYVDHVAFRERFGFAKSHLLTKASELVARAKSNPL